MQGHFASKVKAFGSHCSEKLSGWAGCVHLRMLMLSETESVLILTMPHSITAIHSEHIITKRMGPIPTPHPNPYLAVYVKGHASMRKNKMANRHDAGRKGANIRNTLRQGERVQTSGICSGREKGCKHQGRDFSNGEQAKQKADSLRVKEIKRTDTYPDLCYLATGLWTYIITTGLPTGLPKWITVG